MAQKTDELLEYLAGKGAERYMDYLKALDDASFSKIYPGIIELVLPKFQRQDPKGSQANMGSVEGIDIKVQ